MAEDKKDRRYDVALIAHREDDRILVLQMEGYTDETWRLPQGQKIIIKDSKLLTPAEDAKSILENLVGVCEIGTVTDTGIEKRLDYTLADQGSYTPGTTAKFYAGKLLRFYIVELLSDESGLKKGERVKAIKLITPGELRQHLSGPEYEGIRSVRERYAFLDVDIVKKIKELEKRKRR